MVTVLFSCPLCGLTAEPVAVRPREPNESLPNWLSHAVRPAARKRHRELSPLCGNGDLELRVPVDERADYVGQELWPGTSH